MTAELALGLPLVLALTVGMVWLLAVAAAQIRVIDAARESARSIARGDAVDESVELGRQIAPTGASVSVSRSEGRVVVTAKAKVDGPGGLFDALPGVTVQSTATAVDERGAATVFLLAVIGLLMFLGLALGGVGALVVAQRSAQSAADLAALAGAHALVAGRDACGAAAAVAEANDAELTACTPTGRELVVEATVTGPELAGQQYDVPAQARAGAVPPT